MRVISLGWGVQSWALAAMSALGVLPPVDVAIHADTTHERRETYDLAREMMPWLEKRGVRVVTVKAKAQKRLDPCYMVDKPSVFLPLYSTDIKTQSNGMLRRQCTSEWKIKPIRRWLQENRNNQKCKTWLGITFDEVGRMNKSHVRYVENIYPFIDAFPQPMTRTAVMQWLHEQGLPIPVKSCCIFCPYHDRATWREIKLSGNGDWIKAIEVDKAIRNKRPGYLCYLTAARLPLEECDFSNEQDHGQLTLWDEEECSGMCFL